MVKALTCEVNGALMQSKMACCAALSGYHDICSIRQLNSALKISAVMYFNLALLILGFRLSSTFTLSLSALFFSLAIK